MDLVFLELGRNLAEPEDNERVLLIMVELVEAGNPDSPRGFGIPQVGMYLGLDGCSSERREHRSGCARGL